MTAPAGTSRLLTLATVVAVLVAGPVTFLVTSLGVQPARAGDDLPELTMKRAPEVDGGRRFGRTLVADRGRWAPDPHRAEFQWLRDGNRIHDADERRYPIRPRDVGHRLALVVTVHAPGYAPTSVRVPVGRALHRTAVRRTVHYSVRAKGHVAASMRVFRRTAQRIYDDPRGWRGAGVEFVRVPRGGSFTLWLSVARLVPSFSSECSATWSCRVGRNVIINQTRWLHASPAWNAGSLGRLAYRHMVVNHETGHWLGFGHATCPGPGALAPVMMQQSKGTGGCRFNPFPTLHELQVERSRARVTVERSVAVDLE